jgi:DNA-directed RNA polymerase specialized sigma subunit
VYRPTEQDWLNLWPLIEQLALEAGDQLDDDVKTAAVEGVAEAARDYDPTRNAPFVAFARMLIRDRVKNCLRKFARHPPMQSLDELLEIADWRGDEASIDDVAACGTPGPEELCIAVEDGRARKQQMQEQFSRNARKRWAS